MASFQQSQNLLLASLPPADFELLRPRLRTVEMPRGATLIRSGEIPTSAYFPHSGVISSTLMLQDGEVVEVRMTGRDGALGATLGAGERTSFTSAVVRIEGKASVIDLPGLQVARVQSEALRNSLARYEAFQLAITEQSLACNAHHDVKARLARRLLRLSLTFGSPKFTVTQEDLAEMLGIHRNAISFVAHSMREAGIIRYSRGLVEILDFDALRERSCECCETLMALEDAWEKHSH